MTNQAGSIYTRKYDEPILIQMAIHFFDSILQLVSQIVKVSIVYCVYWPTGPWFESWHNFFFLFDNIQLTKAKRIYNSHYGNGVPAMFIS